EGSRPVPPPGDGDLLDDDAPLRRPEGFRCDEDHHAHLRAEPRRVGGGQCGADGEEDEEGKRSDEKSSERNCQESGDGKEAREEEETLIRFALSRRRCLSVLAKTRIVVGQAFSRIGVFAAYRSDARVGSNFQITFASSYSDLSAPAIRSSLS